MNVDLLMQTAQALVADDKGLLAMDESNPTCSLSERLAAYVAMGARFAKWRAVIAIGEGLPSDAGTAANAHALARCAALCQEAGLVPIVEPEVLLAGEHCADVSAQMLHGVFEQWHVQGVWLEGLLLKPNVVQAQRVLQHRTACNRAARAIHARHGRCGLNGSTTMASDLDWARWSGRYPARPA